jgi:hypothetical protein
MWRLHVRGKSVNLRPHLLHLFILLVFTVAMVNANTKTKSTTTIGCKDHKGAQTSAIIKSLPVLTKHTGTSYNQPVEPVKDWRSDCLAGQNLLIGELCGVLGRLHSNEGLA